MRNDIFSQIKDSLIMKEVAEHYGFEVKRGLMLCPFHNDSHPSMTVYPGSRGWHCFVCGEGGSVIDFVSKLFSINARQAAIRLDNDFHLGLSAERPSQAEAAKWKREKAKKRTEQDVRRAEYMAKLHESYLIRHMRKPPQDSPLMGTYAALIGRLEYLDYWLDNTEWR